MLLLPSKAIFSSNLTELDVLKIMLCVNAKTDRAVADKHIK